MARPLLFLSAGDPSGDNAGSRLITELKQLRPDLEFFGLGGRRLKSQEQEQLAKAGDLAVLGFWEVAKRYFFFRKLFYHCLEEIKKRRPSCVLLVDYPGFNLRLARRVHNLGIPVVYYISPQVWAWGKKRVARIRKYVSMVLPILPFEERFFREHDVPVQFVGHYLLEDIPGEYIQSTPEKPRQIALLPGSRPQEIERMLPPMLEAAQRLKEEYGTTTVIAGIKGAYDYERLVANTDVVVRYDESKKIIHESGLVLVSSGTATLETGIIGRPMVVVYKTGFITYQIARRLVKLDMIGLVNLVLGERVVPELIQNAATPKAMASEMAKYLCDDSYYAGVRDKLGQLPKILGGTGASRRAAEIVSSYL